MLPDLRFALRLLVKSPGFTVAAVGALGFGIGLSTAVFNAFSAMLLRPFPYIVDEHSLVFLNSQRVGHPDSFYELSLPDFLDLRQESKTLEGFTTTVNRTMIFTDGKNPPLRALGADVSFEGFAMLGAKPIHRDPRLRPLAPALRRARRRRRPHRPDQRQAPHHRRRDAQGFRVSRQP